MNANIFRLLFINTQTFKTALTNIDNAENIFVPFFLRFAELSLEAVVCDFEVEIIGYIFYIANK